MITAEFSSIEERYVEDTVRGLRVRVIPKKGFSKAFAFLAVDYGALDTRYSLGGKTYRTPDGIAHYLEHKLFDMPYGDAMNRFAEFGANPNAFTSYTMTAYFFECTDHFTENLKTLTEFVFTPYFTQKSVDKEREIITQEIRMYEDNPGSRIYENLFRAMYRTHPIRVPIAGTAESIREITPELLEQCHRAFYTPENAMLCVAGDVDAAAVFEAVEASLPAVEACTPMRDYGGDDAAFPHSPSETAEMEIARPMFLGGFKCVAPEPGLESVRMNYIGDLAAELLFGPATAFYQLTYKKGLIDESFSAGYESVKGAAIFSAGGDTDRIEEAAKELIGEAQRAAYEGIDTSLFETIKKATLGRKVRVLDSFELCCGNACEYGLEGVDFFQFPEIIQGITAQDVQTFIKENLCAEAFALSEMNPMKKEASG